MKSIKLKKYNALKGMYLFLLLLLILTGCGPSKDQIKSRNDSRERANNAISGAKSMINMAENSGAQKYASEELTLAKNLLLDAEVFFKSADQKADWNKNKKACLEAIETYDKAERKAGEAYKQAKLALNKTNKTKAVEAIDKAKDAIKKAREAEAETLATAEFSKALDVLKSAEELFYAENYTEAEAKAKEASKLAEEAMIKAKAERTRLNEIKKKVDARISKVKLLQDALAEAIKNNDVKKVAKLMIELTEAEIEYAQEKIINSIDLKQSEEDIVKYKEENKVLRDLEKRLFQALENEQSVMQKLEKIKRNLDNKENESNQEKNKLKKSEDKLEELTVEREKLEKERGKW